MRIAITHPTNWPIVRRGTERFINELARFLTGRGHEVTVVSAHPGKTHVHGDFGYRTANHRRLWSPVLGKVGVLEAHSFLATCSMALLRGKFDVVQSCSFTDAYAASLTRRVTGTPYCFWVNGLPPRVKYFRSVSLGGRVFRNAVRKADEVVSLSPFAQEYIAENYGRAGMVLPVPIDTEELKLRVTGRDLDRPVILCTASLNDLRKGGRCLMRSFNHVKETVPTARLRIVYSLPPSIKEEYLGLVDARWRGDVELADSGKLSDLPREYASAAVSVLPSMWEPFGLVVLESMATGTPVVGTRSGALPSLITDPSLGRLFDPGDDATYEPTNAAGLARGIVEAIELSRDPATPRRCRAHAEQYSWTKIGPLFEEIYLRLAKSSSSKRQDEEATTCA